MRIQAKKVFFVTIFNDITEEKEKRNKMLEYTGQLEVLTQELFKFQLAVEDASDAIMITDSKGMVIYANPATEKITGYSSKEIIGNSSRLWGNIVMSNRHNKNKESVWETINKVSEKYTGDLQNTRKDGQIYYSQITISPVFDERKKLIYYVCIERDVTKLREIEKQKEEFVYFVSHELKNPIASILMIIEIFQRESGANFPNEYLTYLLDIKDSAKTMEKFINKLLDVSKIEAGSFFQENEPIDIRIVLNQVVSNIKHIAADKQIRLMTQFDNNIPIIQSDEKALSLVFTNLISNAIRYTDKNGEVKIKVGRKNSSLYVAVADNGIGIAENELEKIFYKQYRASNAKNSDIKGSGLGLYIVKSIIEEIGAKIEVSSKLQTGSSFTVIFNNHNK